MKTVIGITSLLVCVGTSPMLRAQPGSEDERREHRENKERRRDDHAEKREQRHDEHEQRREQRHEIGRAHV